MKKLLIQILIILFLIQNVNAEIIIYDNVTTSQYKQIRITDDINIKYFNEYSYDIYINNSYFGTFKKDDLITIPDDSDIIIYVPNNLQTNFNDTSDFVKRYLYIALISLSGIIILLIAGFLLIKKLWRK